MRAARWALFALLVWSARPGVAAAGNTTFRVCESACKGGRLTIGLAIEQTQPSTAEFFAFAKPFDCWDLYKDEGGALRVPLGRPKVFTAGTHQHRVTLSRDQLETLGVAPGGTLHIGGRWAKVAAGRAAELVTAKNPTAAYHVWGNQQKTDGTSLTVPMAMQNGFRSAAPSHRWLPKARSASLAARR